MNLVAAPALFALLVSVAATSGPAPVDVDLDDEAAVDDHFDTLGYFDGGEPSMDLDPIEIPLGLPDGRWDFTLSVSGGFESTEGGDRFEWRGGGTGTGTFVVERGGVFGAWSYDGGGVALFSVDGQVASVPTPNSFDDGLVGSADGAVLEMSGGILDQVVQVRPVTFSCTVWEGALIDALVFNLGVAGFDSALGGYFKAIRTGSGDVEGDAELDADLEALTADFRAFAADAGSIAEEGFAEGLGALLARADALVEEVGASGACAQDRAGTFASVLGSQVGTLVFDLLDDGLVSMPRLISVAQAAVRAGVAGSGSTNAPFANDVELALETAGQELAQRLLADGAPDTGDLGELRSWIVFADGMGWEDGLTDDQIGLVATA